MSAGEAVTTQRAIGTRGARDVLNRGGGDGRRRVVNLGLAAAVAFAAQACSGEPGQSAAERVAEDRAAMAGGTVNGVPVVGSGSKIAITVLNDGTVESFRYDWPVYAVAGRATVSVTGGELLTRVQQVLSSRTGVAMAAQSVSVPAGLTQPVPIALDPSMTLERLECGYFDAGFGNRAVDAPVQSGCRYHAVHSISADGVTARAGYAGAIPAGSVPEADASWSEAVVLAGGSPSTGPTGSTAATPGPDTHAASGKK